MSPSVIDRGVTPEAQSTSSRGIFDRLEAVFRSPSGKREARRLLRGLSLPFLQSLNSIRQENIEPVERRLQFLARVLSAQIDDEGAECDPKYLLGRIDALLDLSGVAIDRSLSDQVLRAVKRKHGMNILQCLVEGGDTSPTQLAEVLQIKQSHLSNVLRWMEEADLIRRVGDGKRSVCVSLGPKGEAAYRALQSEPSLEKDKAREPELVGAV